MNRRNVLTGAAVAAIAAPAIARADECPIDPEVLTAAGTLCLLAFAAHGHNWLSRAIAALGQASSGGCGK